MSEIPQTQEQRIITCLVPGFDEGQSGRARSAPEGGRPSRTVFSKLLGVISALRVMSVLGVMS